MAHLAIEIVDASTAEIIMCAIIRLGELDHPFVPCTGGASSGEHRCANVAFPVGLEGDGLVPIVDVVMRIFEA